MHISISTLIFSIIYGKAAEDSILLSAGNDSASTAILTFSHLEGSSPSVGRPGYCHSPVLAVKNVDVCQPILLNISTESIQKLSMCLLNFGLPLGSHLLPPCPALFLSYGYHLYVWHVHTSVVVSASGVLLFWLNCCRSPDLTLHFFCALSGWRLVSTATFSFQFSLIHQHLILLFHCPAFSPIISW